MEITILSAAVLLMLSAPSFCGEKSIYGVDNRLDFFAAPAELQALSDSVVSFWNPISLSKLNSGGVKLNLLNFGKRMNLCPGEKFSEQASGGDSSGVLVGDDLVLTAGHVIENDEQCGYTTVLFGFSIKGMGGKAPDKIPPGDVYRCVRIVKRFFADEPAILPAGQTYGPDFALIQLDRKVAGHKPLTIDRSAGLKNGDGIFIIGYPWGLPLKVAGDAVVRDFSPPATFVANVDNFNGNSGSPVFSARTGQIEGILVRGDGPDFVKTSEGCNKTTVFSQAGGLGSIVTKIGTVSSYIPKLRGEKSYKDVPGVTGIDPSGMRLPAGLRSGDMNFN